MILHRIEPAYQAYQGLVISDAPSIPEERTGFRVTNEGLRVDTVGNHSHTALGEPMGCMKVRPCVRISDDQIAKSSQGALHLEDGARQPIIVFEIDAGGADTPNDS